MCPPESPYRVPILQRGQHEAAIAQVLRQRLVVETFVVLLIPQGEGLRQHIHLSSDVGLESVCLASLPSALTPLAYGLEQLGTNKVPSLLLTASHCLTLSPYCLKHSAGVKGREEKVTGFDLYLVVLRNQRQILSI